MAIIPLRLHILNEFQTLLKTISIANGYTTDLGENVYYGRSDFDESDGLPLVSFLEPSRPLDANAAPDRAGAREVNWNILLQGFVKNDRRNPTAPAYYLLSDVLRCIDTENKKGNDWNIFDLRDLYGPNAPSPISAIIPDTPVVRPADEVSANAHFWLPLIFKFTEDLTDPFVDIP